MIAFAALQLGATPPSPTHTNPESSSCQHQQLIETLTLNWLVRVMACARCSPDKRSSLAAASSCCTTSSCCSDGHLLMARQSADSLFRSCWSWLGLHMCCNRQLAREGIQGRRVLGGQLQIRFQRREGQLLLYRRLRQAGLTRGVPRGTREREMRGGSVSNAGSPVYKRSITSV
jgi:hypothetical protein